MKSLVEAGAVPGILAYSTSAPVGWCSVSPRTTLAGLREAGTFRHFDDPDVWSIVCFYLVPEYRGRGVMTELLRAAIAHATRHGAQVIEAYPVDPTVPGAVEQTGFMGIQAVFTRADFVHIAHADGALSLGAYTAGNRTMRYYVDPKPLKPSTRRPPPSVSRSPTRRTSSSRRR
jgi:GNAT superfamily N-acetyltransferase